MPAPIFFRQSVTTDLGAMAKRVGAKHLILTHLGPSLGAAIHNRWKVPGGPLTEADYRKGLRQVASPEIRLWEPNLRPSGFRRSKQLDGLRHA
jgi:hypothetical protein